MPRIKQDKDGNVFLEINPMQDVLDVFPNLEEECSEDWDYLMELMGE